MNYQDYYKTLGVSRTASEKEIKQAYRRLARQYHPDRNPGNSQAEETFKHINEAYEVLGNADNRAKYDRLGSAYHQFQQAGGGPSGFDFSQWFAGSQGRSQPNVDFGDLFGGQGGGGSFSDFFQAIFGGAQRQYATGGQPATRSLNVEQPVRITLHEAYHGTDRTFQQNGSRFTAKIPAGARHGSKIRLRGKGNQASGQRGDLFLVIDLVPHDQFTVDGTHLRTTVTVDDTTAVLGGHTLVPTLTGDVKLTIPAGIETGQTVRLAGRGMPRRKSEGGGHGDLLVQINIQPPTEISAAEKRLYEQLAQLRAQKSTDKGNK